MKEHAQAEAVLVELGVASELMADLSHKKQSARNDRVLQESSM